MTIVGENKPVIAPALSVVGPALQGIAGLILVYMICFFNGSNYSGYYGWRTLGLG